YQCTPSIDDCRKQSDGNQERHDVDHILELGEHAGINVPHANVVIQRADDFNIPSDVVDPYLHFQSLRILRSPHQNLPKGHEVCGDEKERRYGNCKASHWSEFLHRLFFWVKEFRFTSETPSPFGSLSARVLSFNHAGRELNRYIAIGRRDPDVSGHFLVECRAKVGTVERIDTRLFWQPFQRLRFAWHNEYLRIAGTLDSETVWYVPILFQVCHMEIDFIADTHPFNIIRRQVRANCSHIHVNFLPFPFHRVWP